MRILALFLSALVLIVSCQKEPDVTLEPTTDPAIDSLTITYFSPDSVTIGMTITIGGTGFDTTLANNIVKVNGVQITLVSVSDSVIVATISESATTGKVTVTINGKTVTSLTDLVISQKPPATPEDNIWVKKADYEGDVADEGPEYYHSFSLNGKGYFLKRNQLWEYSPATDSWTQKTSAPLTGKVNSYGFCFTIQDKAYIGLGAPGPGEIELTEYKQVWEYNGITDAWMQKSDFPGSPRVVPFSFSIGNTGYIGGGDTLNAGLSSDYVFDVWKYESTTDTWTRLADFPGLRAISLSGVSVENDGFVVELGANNPTAPLTNYKDIYIWKYDRINDTWQKKAKLPSGSKGYDGGGTAFIINNQIYLGAGAADSTEVNGQTVRNNFWMYDPMANTWTSKKDIGGGLRLFGRGFALNDKGYIGLGTGATADDIKADFWQYNP